MVWRRIEHQLKQALWRAVGAVLGANGAETALADLSALRSILVIRPDRLGDVVLSTPVYESIKKSCPQARLDVVVSRACAEIVRDNPHIDTILEYDKRKPWELAGRLLRGSYDLAIVLNRQFTATAAVMALLSRARYRLGYRNRQAVWAFNLLAPGKDGIQHEVRNNLDLLRHLGLRHIHEQPAIYFSLEETGKIDRLLKELRRWPQKPLVLVKPGTRVPAWGWSLDKFRQVCDHLAGSGEAEVFVIVGPGEKTQMRALFAGSPDGVTLLPRLTTKELARLIQRSRLLFCNHTGIMHLATAVGTPLAVIFKHGQIARWGAFQIPSVVLEERDGDTLTVNTVCAAIRQLMDSAEKSGRHAPR
jgi:ADP-heptose:LPS heptosyltransferase